MATAENKPKYADLANEAILALKERSGSSLAAIKKYIASKYPAFDFQPQHLRAALKRGVTNETYTMVKASYKISANAKKDILAKLDGKPAPKAKKAPAAAPAAAPVKKSKPKAPASKTKKAPTKGKAAATKKVTKPKEKKVKAPPAAAPAAAPAAKKTKKAPAAAPATSPKKKPPAPAKKAKSPAKKAKKVTKK
jgi:histone H1/5